MNNYRIPDKFTPGGGPVVATGLIGGYIRIARLVFKWPAQTGQWPDRFHYMETLYKELTATGIGIDWTCSVTSGSNERAIIFQMTNECYRQHTWTDIHVK